MSKIIKRTPGKLVFKNKFGDVVKEIPLYRETYIPKNKYSQQYKDAKKQMNEQQEKE